MQILDFTLNFPTWTFSLFFLIKVFFESSFQRINGIKTHIGYQYFSGLGRLFSFSAISLPFVFDALYKKESVQNNHNFVTGKTNRESQVPHKKTKSYFVEICAACWLIFLTQNNTLSSSRGQPIYVCASFCE